jgi:transcriptional regulator with XRE-family HTH domain
MQDEIRETEVALAKSRIRVLGISQNFLAEQLGVSQSQVSRVLSGRTSASSRLAKDVCNYAINSVDHVEKSSIAANEDLMNALVETWDGTPAHARALAVVIRSLGVLHPHPTRDEDT